MARGRITLYEIPAEQRAKGAATARKSLRNLLNLPGLTPVQLQQIHERMAWVEKWARCDIGHLIPDPNAPPKAGTLALPPKPGLVSLPALPAASRTPTNHSVSIVEEMQLSDDPSKG